VRSLHRDEPDAGEALVEAPQKWKWSSAASHIKNKDDKLVKVEQLNAIVQKPWAKFLSLEVTGEERHALQRHERTGRPLGSLKFLERPEKKLGRALRQGKPGPKPKDK